MKKFALIAGLLVLALAGPAVGQQLTDQEQALAKFVGAEAVAQEKAKPKRITSDDGRTAEHIAANIAKQKTFKRGAIRTPAHKIAAATKAGLLRVHSGTLRGPPQVLMVPPKMSYLGNDQEGDCVTAESCFSMEAYSVYLGLPEIVITDQTAMAWAASHGVANGADLLQVIQMMQQDGITDSLGKLYKAGVPASVQFSVEATLQSAIAIGPISLGIDANALPSGAGNSSGWFSFGGSPGQFSNEDHDVSICGYGDAATLFAALKTPVPAGAPSGTLYLLYTWAGIGVVDHAWIMSTAGEAYVRAPTVVGLGPIPPPVVYVPPFTLYAAGAALPGSYPDLTSATATGQAYADANQVAVAVKDANGQLAAALTPTVTPPTPIPPQPTPTPDPVCRQRFHLLPLFGRFRNPPVYHVR